MGTLLVDGTGSKITAPGATDWGLNPGNAATVTFSNSGVGTFGSVHLSGSGGAATLNLQSSGNLYATSFQAGSGSGSAQLSLINIAGGALNDAGAATFLGGADVKLSGGGLVLNGDATFATGSNLNWSGGALSIASGHTLTFSGSTGTFAVGTGLGNGATIHVTNGAQVVNSTFLDIGSTGDGGANGTLLIDGSGSKYITGGTYTDLGFNTGAFGTITLATSGAASFNNGLHLAGNGGKALLTVSGGSINVVNLVAGSTGASATINITGGVLNSTGTSQFNNGAVVSDSGIGAKLNLVGNATFSTGSTFTLAGLGQLTTGSGQTLAFDGGVGTISPAFGPAAGNTIRITNGGMLTCAQPFDVANGLSSGTLLVDGTNSKLNSTSVLPAEWGVNAGSTATVTFSNGGVGTFAGYISPGFNGGTCNLSVLSSAALNVNGIVAGGSAGAATITIGGGTINTNAASTFDNHTTVSLTGGGLNLGGDATFTSGATLNRVGAPTLSIASGHTLTFDSGVGSFSASTGYGLPGGATLKVINGGHFASDEYFAIGSSFSPTYGPNGTLLVSGSGSSYTNTGSFAPLWGYQTGDNATITFDDHSVGTLSSGVTMAYTGAVANLSVLNGASLNIGSGFVVGAFGGPGSIATITINGGTLNESSTNDLGFFGGTTVNYLAGGLNLNDVLIMSDAKVLLSTGHNKVLNVASLSMGGTSKIDLADNQMNVKTPGASALSTVRGYLLTGHNGGNLLGNGITSSGAAANPIHAALGYLDTGTSILVKYASLGDANLDGKVNALDFNAVATNFGGTSKFWLTGDFNYDGTTNTQDFTALGGNFNQTLTFPAPPIDATPLGSLVPEPFGMVGLAGAYTFARRRRYRDTTPAAMRRTHRKTFTT